MFLELLWQPSIVENGFRLLSRIILTGGSVRANERRIVGAASFEVFIMVAVVFDACLFPPSLLFLFVDA